MTEGGAIAVRLVALAFITGCGTGVHRIDAPTNGSSTAGDYFNAKCSSGIDDCLHDAAEQCAGTYTVLHKESHAGGIFADALPGPVTWYTMTFRCGADAAEAARKAREGAIKAFVMPRCSSDWAGKCGFLTDKLAAGTSIDAPPLAIESNTEASPPADGLVQFALTRVCNAEPPITEECRVTFRESFARALRLRYPRADDTRLLTWCEQHPTDCDPERADRLRLLEEGFLDAHDRVVERYLKRAMADLEDQQTVDRAQASEQRTAMRDEDRRRRANLEAINRAMTERRENTIHVHVHQDP